MHNALFPSAHHALFKELEGQPSPSLHAHYHRYDSHMAPASKKKSPPSRASKRTRLSQAEATVRMLHATNQLLLQYVPGEVTVARICDAAGVHTDYVARYFGSREELMCQAIDAAFLGVFLNAKNEESSRLNIVLEGNIDVMQLAQARVQTIAYLLGSGVSPERFQSSQRLVLESVFSQSTNPKVGERTKMNLILVGTLLVQAMSTFAEVNDMSEQQKKDMISYIGYMSLTGETVQEALGWGKPPAKKKK
jgi:AcrR family transcriptional regulator